MKCPTCVAENTRSTVQSLGAMTTCMGWMAYYDEDGNYHSHDPNRQSNGYRCSNGHEWVTSTLIRCPSCGYGKEQP